MRIGKGYKVAITAAAVIVIAGICLAGVYFYRLSGTKPAREASSIGGERETIVRNASELVRALRPGAVIKLRPGDYDLNAYADRSSSDDRYFNNGVIRGLKGVTIEAAGDRPVDLVTRNGFAPALAFDDCDGVALRNLRLGHSPKLKGGCSGDVIAFASCNDIEIDGCELFGCGLRGLSLSQVKGLVFKNSYIRECADDIMALFGSSNLLFQGSSFLDNGGNVYTSECENVKFVSCVFVGREYAPTVYDANQTAVLTDEGTIAGEVGGYTSRYMRRFDDWLSRVALEDVWFSTRLVYQENLELFHRLQTILGDELDAVCITRKPKEDEALDWEIDLRPHKGKDSLTYEDVCRTIQRLAGESESLKKLGATRFIVRFRGREETLVRVEADGPEFSVFLAGGSQARLDRYADVLLASPGIDPAAFFGINGKIMNGEAAVKILAQLVGIKREVADEDYINGGDFQEFVYREAHYKGNALYHLVDLRQKLPLLGDFIHHVVIASFRVDASTGRVYYLDGEGEYELAALPAGAREAVIAYTGKETAWLGRLDGGKSAFLFFTDGPERLVVEAEVFNDEGASGMARFEVAEVESGWDVVKVGRIRSFNQDEVD